MRNLRNYWWLTVNPRVFRFKDFDNGDLFAYSSKNEDGSDRKIHNNFIEAKKGEMVFIYESVPVGRIIGICQVEKEWANDMLCFKKIETLTEYVKRTDIEQNRDIVNIEPFRYQEGIFFKLTEDEYKAIYNIVREMNPKHTYMIYPKYDKEQFLKDCFFDSEEYDELRELILDRKNVVLQGPPGTGKTYVAKRMAFSILGKKDTGKILNVQFHPKYSVDEFIEGFRPDDIGIYKYREGCFKHFCNQARNDKENKYFLLIDEINRGDVIKVFGDTFMLLEPDKRGKENYVELPASKERFYIPSNLYIMGTMNIADKEQTMSDYAVRRRFSFYNVNPIFGNSQFIKFCEKSPLKMKIIDTVKEINGMVSGNKQIGHCYFCKDESDKDLIRTVKYELIPLAQEYFKDEEPIKDLVVKKLKAAIEK